MYCFRNGEIIPCEDAVVHVSDLGLLRSYAAFDYLRTYNGRPFRLKDHLERFRNSARGLTLPLDYSDEQIGDIINDLLGRSGPTEAGVRFVITGGNSPDSMTPVKPNFFIIIEELPQYPPDSWEKGVKLITSEYMRDVPGIKSTGYLNAIKLKPMIDQSSAHDVLYCHDGQVLELARDSFFLFQGDTLLTPKENILLGITRMVVLELCQDVFPLEERAVRCDELGQATEAFLTGTTKGVMPVVKVDDTVIGDGIVGSNTRKLMELFKKHVERN
jgi:D-alanine transaminase/branched-chain amino acid aminotransferase